MATVIFTAVVLLSQYGPQSQWGWDGHIDNRTGFGYARLYGNGYYPPAAFYGGGTCGPSGCCSPSRRCSTSAPILYQLPSPWNAAVAELRARGTVRSSDRRPPQILAYEVDRLASKVTDLYTALRDASTYEKAELRKEWLQARDDLDKARLKAAKLARR